jgi:hypothetical protein
MATRSQELVFLVRIWLHGGDDPGAGELRGAIHDVRSGQRFYVAGTRDIADFIDARIVETKRSAR